MARLPRLPPLHALAAFEGAARLGGFSQAAAELCVTPSAVSHRIRLLEGQLGVQLFDRSSTGVRLSEAGQRYLGGVREAFDKLAHLSGHADGTLTLRVSSPPTFARNLLIPRLPDFYRHWPEIEIEIAIVAPMEERPERHDVDIRFGREPFDERPCIRLFDDRLLVLAAPAYLASHAHAEPADLARCELLRCPLVPWRHWFAAVAPNWPEPSRGLAFTDLGILLEAAASGLGVALCPSRISEHWIRGGQLAPMFDLGVPAPATYHVLADREQRAEVTAFTEWLCARFA